MHYVNIIWKENKYQSKKQNGTPNIKIRCFPKVVPLREAIPGAIVAQWSLLQPVLDVARSRGRFFLTLIETKISKENFYFRSNPPRLFVRILACSSVLTHLLCCSKRPLLLWCRQEWRNATMLYISSWNAPQDCAFLTWCFSVWSWCKIKVPKYQLTARMWPFLVVVLISASMFYVSTTVFLAFMWRPTFSRSLSKLGGNAFAFLIEYIYISLPSMMRPSGGSVLLLKSFCLDRW